MADQNKAGDGDRLYTDELFHDCFGDRTAALAPDHRAAALALFEDILWNEGIEALTPGRLDAILHYAADLLPA